MKKIPFIDVSDKDISPAIYLLLFSGIIVEIKGNELCYMLDAESLKEIDLQNEEFCKKLWQERINRGWNNCYFDDEKMKQFIKNPCTWQESIVEFFAFLKNNKIKDEFIVKIWW